MERYEYSLIEIGDNWEVHAPDRLEPIAVYRRQDHAMAYAREAARQRTELDGVAACVGMHGLAPAAGIATGTHLGASGPHDAQGS